MIYIIMKYRCTLVMDVPMFSLRTLLSFQKVVSHQHWECDRKLRKDNWETTLGDKRQTYKNYGGKNEQV